MEISGKIKWIDEIRTYGSNGFRKKELVITTQEQYPQNILIEFTQEKCELLDKYEIDDNIKIGINIRGREWINPEGQTKYFNSIQGWRIEKLSSQEADANIPPVPPAEAFEPADDVNDNEPDDLPF